MNIKQNKILNAVTKIVYGLIINFVLLLSLSYSQNHKLIIHDGATFTGNGSITIKDSIRNNSATLGLRISGKVILSGDNQAILANAASGSLTIDTLSVRGTGTKTIVGTIAIAESLNVFSGTTLTINTDTLRVQKIANNGGTINTNNATIEFNNDVNGNGALAVAGNGAISFKGSIETSNITLANNSTAKYEGSNQTIVNTNYGNLVLNNTGTKTFPTGTTNIAGELTLSNGAVADAISNSTTINYNGTSAQTIAAIQYYNLSIADHGANQITLATDTIKVANSFTNSVNNTNIVNTGSTFAYTGADQTVTPFAYNNLVLSGSGTKTVALSQTTNGNVEQKDGVNLAVNNGVIWQIDGSLTTNNGFTNNGEIIIGN